ncbi:MAG: AAA family ATPase [Myxococcales bacterium]|nr:AAA family ATPase [Myxococcales bacterium]
MDRATPLRDRLRARYPLVGVLHSDERDAVRVLGVAAQGSPLTVQVATFGALEPAGVARELLERLVQQERPTVLALPQADRLLGDAGFARLLLEHLDAIERAGHAVVLLAARPWPPTDLDRDLAVVELPLPGPPELAPLAQAAFAGADAGHTDAAVAALAGLTLGQARRALKRVRQAGLAGPVAVAELQHEKRDLVARSSVLEVVDDVPQLDRVGGLDALKAWLLRRREALTPAARAYGLPPPRGAFMVGVQGCGKSLIAKASAGALGLPLARLDLARLYAEHGSPDEHLRRALQVAEAMAPCVLWIDEIDKAFATVGDAPSESGARLFGALLTWLDRPRPGVFVAATANRADHLPAELLRKGRFDETFFVDLPDRRVREEIVAIHLRASGRAAADFDTGRLADAADKLTGAEVAEALVEALAVAFSEGRALTTDDVEAVLSKSVPLVETYAEQVRALRDWARRRCRPAAFDRSLHDLYHAARAHEPRPGGRP